MKKEQVGEWSSIMASKNNNQIIVNVIPAALMYHKMTEGYLAILKMLFKTGNILFKTRNIKRCRGGIFTLSLGSLY